MGEMSEFTFKVRLFLKAYKWRRIDPIPWSPLEKPLSRCRLALVSSAGFVLPGQDHFDDKKVGGDPTFRPIPSDSQVSTLIDTHRSESFDHTALARDPNVAFPIDILRDLDTQGVIGQLHPEAYSFMGAAAQRRIQKESAPEWVAMLREAEIDVVLLVPV